MGSLGALISVLLRSDQLEIDASAGRRVHYFEGIMRALIGALAGLLFVLAVKSNVLLGAINRSDKAFTILLAVSIVAGASERLLPNLINQISAILVGNLERTAKQSIVETKGEGPPDDDETRDDGEDEEIVS